jgi:hypothetical protein
MYLVKSILKPKDVQNIYDHLINDGVWKISGAYANASEPELCYPRSLAMDGNGIYNPFVAGYFTAIMAKIRDEVEEQYGL